MKIEVLGSGCAKCKQTHRIMEKALKEEGVNAQLLYVTDVAEIVSRGIVSTPAIVIDGQVVLSGKVPSLEEAKKLISGK